jgi:hypothetical protein
MTFQDCSLLSSNCWSPDFMEEGRWTSTELRRLTTQMHMLYIVTAVWAWNRTLGTYIHYLGNVSYVENNYSKDTNTWVEQFSIVRYLFSSELMMQWLVLGTQLCDMIAHLGYKPWTVDPFGQQISKLFTSKMPQTVWIISSSNLKHTKIIFVKWRSWGNSLGHDHLKSQNKMAGC